MEKMKQLMHKSRDNAISFVGAPCMFRKGEISFAFGGFGTFLNRASIERMAGPIFCYDERPLSVWQVQFSAMINVNKRVLIWI
jgi:hypothetical protein